MAKRQENAPSGEMETVKPQLLSELIIECLSDALSVDEIKEITDQITVDPIVFAIPDTGKCQFKPSAPYTVTSGKDKGSLKDSKACFLIAEFGSQYAGDPVGLTLDNGHAAGLDLTAKFSVIAQSRNAGAKTVAEALQSKPVAVTNEPSAKEQVAALTGTNN